MIKKEEKDITKPKNTLKAWQKIFEGPARLTKEEAKSMHRAVETFRKEYGFEG